MSNGRITVRGKKSDGVRERGNLASDGDGLSNFALLLCS